MSQIFLRRLRISIAVLSFVTGCLLAAYYGEIIRSFSSRGLTLSVFRNWIPTVRIVFLIVIFGSYVYSVRYPTQVHRFLRAFLLVGMAATLLFIHLRDVHWRILAGEPYICPPEFPACGLFRAVEFFTILFGFLIILEVGVTLKNGPLEPRNTPKAVEIVSPLQPIQPQPYYQQPYAYYPPQQPGQPLHQHGSSMKYEAQGPVMMQQYQQPHPPYFQPQHMPPPPQQQQQYHQPHQQQQQLQQQPHPYSNVNYSAPPPQVPGSMVTTTPQSGGQPMATPTSPGFSIAVSPVMPSEGYSTPLVGHSPVQPAP
ncbi:hypothetical protein BGZ67_001508 [Mortierella alpina]|nr:hypothetical protein BGZ67_001508 [Mortierella alpina]